MSWVILHDYNQTAILHETDEHLPMVLHFFCLYLAIPLDFIAQGWYLFGGQVFNHRLIFSTHLGLKFNIHWDIHSANFLVLQMPLNNNDANLIEFFQRSPVVTGPNLMGVAILAQIQKNWHLLHGPNKSGCLGLGGSDEITEWTQNDYFKEDKYNVIIQKSQWFNSQEISNDVINIITLYYGEFMKPKVYSAGLPERKLPSLSSFVFFTSVHCGLI